MTQRTVKLLKKRLPITQWLPRYQKSDLVGDIIAGITVGMTVVPQSMAYAAIAGLTPEVMKKGSKVWFLKKLNAAAWVRFEFLKNIFSMVSIHPTGEFYFILFLGRAAKRL